MHTHIAELLFMLTTCWIFVYLVVGCLIGLAQMDILYMTPISAKIPWQSCAVTATVLTVLLLIFVILQDNAPVVWSWGWDEFFSASVTEKHSHNQ